MGEKGLSDFDVEAATKVMNNSWKNQDILPARFLLRIMRGETRKESPL